MSEPRRIVIGMTGASGVAYGIRALELLAAEPNVETHLVVTAAARITVGLETSHFAESGPRDEASAKEPTEELRPRMDGGAVCGR